MGCVGQLDRTETAREKTQWGGLCVCVASGDMSHVCEGALLCNAGH